MWIVLEEGTVGSGGGVGWDLVVVEEEELGCLFLSVGSMDVSWVQLRE